MKILPTEEQDVRLLPLIAQMLGDVELKHEGTSYVVSIELCAYFGNPEDAIIHYHCLGECKTVLLSDAIPDEEQRRAAIQDILVCALSVV